MKYLIIGLGNIGKEYENTRHNIGFMALDYFAKSQTDCVFSLERHAYIAKTKFKGRTIILAKPTTYMNLSGKALKFWMDKEDIPLENILIILDDIALPLGTIRMRMTGSDGGHNGLSHIIETLGHNKFNRLRFGIGDNFSKGRQVDYVLGDWSDEETTALKERLDTVSKAVKEFALAGLNNAMNNYNGK